jgi:hypothetical protein
MDSLWGELCNSRACTRKATHMLLIFWEQIYNGFTSQAPGKSTWKPTWQGTGPSGTALLHPYLCPRAWNSRYKDVCHTSYRVCSSCTDKGQNSPVAKNSLGEVQIMLIVVPEYLGD